VTLLAGVYSRDPAKPVSEQVCESLRRALSRHPSEEIQTFMDGRCFLLKADIGAYGSPALQLDQNGVSYMAGEPLLAHPDGQPRTRALDLEELHADLSRGDAASLKRARGVFCLAHYQPDTGSLTLATDKLGIRPIYYWIGESYVIFATALRILESVAEIPKVMDIRAVTETFALEYPLSDRTPFAEVSLMRAAEIIHVDGNRVTRDQYWAWDNIRESSVPTQELAAESYRIFLDAVALRNGADSTTAAFLSGGLDSRAIVAALVQRGLHVHTFNFSLTGTQDQVFGADFARKIGTTHTEQPRVVGRQVSAKIMADAWSASAEGASHPAERPNLVWSGDGGSVTLGHVYLNRPMVAAARAGRTDAAINLYLSGWGGTVPRRLIRREMRETLSKIPYQGLLEEFSALNCADPGRALHLVMMLNDQHRHLAAHFESIDLDRLELQMPFFDSVFVSSVLRVPIDTCLEHTFYMQWLRCFPSVVLSVPWQAYPGHEPCPLEIPAALAYQWEESLVSKVRDSMRHDLLRQTSEILRASDFPDVLLRRHFLRLAAWVYRLGIRDLGYVTQAAEIYYKYWTQCRGNYLSPMPIEASAARAR
jgi:asparagine synthase (glutamine-hydrolysing)